MRHNPDNRISSGSTEGLTGSVCLVPLCVSVEIVYCSSYRAKLAGVGRGGGWVRGWEGGGGGWQVVSAS